MARRHSATRCRVRLLTFPQARAPTPLHAAPLPPGKGAYGTVYKAVDAVSGEVVAIKVISLADQPAEDFKQIEKEIEFLAACDHPNVVRYLVSEGGGGEGEVNTSTQTRLCATCMVSFHGLSACMRDGRGTCHRLLSMATPDRGIQNAVTGLLLGVSSAPFNYRDASPPPPGELPAPH